MKTGEFLITVNKKDINYLVKELLHIENNIISPFMDIPDAYTKPFSDTGQLREVARNKYAAECLKIIAQPVSTCQIRIGGPATDRVDLHICKINGSSIALYYDSGDSCMIQFADNMDDLIDFLKTFLTNEAEVKGEMIFPGNINAETFFLLLNLIDSYRYVYYRDALSQKESKLFKLTVGEFSNLMKRTAYNIDYRWMMSNLIALLPEAIKIYKSTDACNYNFLFDNGYILSAGDKSTGDEYILLNVLSIEAGAEFMNTWYKTIGIEMTHYENGTVWKTPEAFICVTADSTHCFLLDNNSGNINYKLLDSAGAYHLLNCIITSMKSDRQEQTSADSKIITKYCANCGKEIKPNSKFCGNCGIKILPNS